MGWDLGFLAPQEGILAGRTVPTVTPTDLDEGVTAGRFFFEPVFRRIRIPPSPSAGRR